jgi:rRNA small subunit pseudouridine methyltransferase Nep1
LLSFVLAESALELVPKEIRGSPSVASDARRRGVDPSGILLDRSFHHSAMTRLRDSERRGRPDLVHVTLLNVTGTPLYLEGRVKVYVHTRDDVIVEFREKTRIPKNYLRFRGLMEKVLVERPEGELVSARNAGLKELVRKALSPDFVVGLSVQGSPMEPGMLGKQLAVIEEACVIVGGFPRGHFSPSTLSLVEELVRIDDRPLEAHVVAARVVYEVERALFSTNR